MSCSTRHGGKFCNRPVVIKLDGGLTVVELLVAIAIAGIMFAYAMSAMITYLPKQAMKEAANAVVQQLEYARFEAVRQNRHIVVRFNSIGSQSSSITVFSDTNRNCAVDAGEPQTSAVILPTNYRNAYVFSVTDNAATSVTLIAMGADGTVKAINGASCGTRGTMPITTIVKSPAVTSPAQYTVYTERSGISRVE